MSLKLNDLLPFANCRHLQNWQKARKKQIGSANLQQNLKAPLMMVSPAKHLLG
jgi:hypothetical protein